MRMFVAAGGGALALCRILQVSHLSLFIYLNALSFQEVLSGGIHAIRLESILRRMEVKIGKKTDRLVRCTVDQALSKGD